jgi:hypothetical protein
VNPAIDGPFSQRLPRHSDLVSKIADPPFARPKQRIVLALAINAELELKLADDLSIKLLARIDGRIAFGIQNVSGLFRGLAGFAELDDARHQQITLAQLAIGADGTSEFVPTLEAADPVNCCCRVLAVRFNMDNHALDQAANDGLSISIRRGR